VEALYRLFQVFFGGREGTTTSTFGTRLAHGADQNVVFAGLQSVDVFYEHHKNETSCDTRVTGRPVEQSSPEALFIPTIGSFTRLVNSTRVWPPPHK
jgi:hypothetical protein